MVTSGVNRRSFGYALRLAALTQGFAQDDKSMGVAYVPPITMKL